MAGQRTISKRASLSLVVVVLLVATAGCAGIANNNSDGNSTDGKLVEYAPANSSVLVHVDGDVLTDDETQTVVDGVMNSQSEGESVDSETMLTMVSAETGFDPTSFEEALVFSDEDSVDDSDYSGILVSGNWTEEELTTLLENEDSEYESTTYAGYTMYHNTTADESSYVGVLGEGTFVLGSEASVKDSLDVANGDADAVDGAVREEYDAASGALITAVVGTPDDTSPTGSPGQVGSSAFDSVDVMTMTYSTPNGTVESGMAFSFGNETRASQAGTQLDSLLALYNQSAEDEVVREELSNIDVATDGDRVTMTYSNDPETLVDRLNTLYSSEYGSSTVQPPAVQFEWETDGSDVIVTHHGGNTLDTSNIRVVDQTGEPVAASFSNSAQLHAGEEITITNGVEATELRVVWDNGDTSAVLAAYTPPNQ